MGKVTKKRSSTEVEINENQDTKRVTFLLPPALDDLVEIHSRRSGLQKNEIARRALKEYLAHYRKELEAALAETQNALGQLIPPTGRRND